MPYGILARRDTRYPKGVTSMADLLVHLPEDLYDRLLKEAESKGVTVEDILVSLLRQRLGSLRDGGTTETARLERFVHDSGLFAPPHQKLGPELEKRAKHVSSEERERLSEALSRGKSLSEMIIADRG